MSKIDTVANVTEMYKRLPQEKQTFVLGIMQGILIEHPEQGNQLLVDKEKKTGQTRNKR